MNRWEVYWADVPFEEDPSQIKRRPVIIARDNTVYVLTLRVTSHEAREYDPYDYPLQEWQHANLTTASVVRIRKISQLRPDNIHEYIGKLHPVDILGIQNCMQRFIAERNRRRKSENDGI